MLIFKTGLLSITLVFVQFSSIGYLLASHHWLPPEWWLMIPATLSGILAFWSIGVMRNSRINIFPDLLPGSKLITAGPYRLIRHPMYTSLFIVFIPLVFNQFNTLRLVALLLMTLALAYKMAREEKQLKEAFIDYKTYTTLTHRLIPYLF